MCGFGPMPSAQRSLAMSRLLLVLATVLVLALPAGAQAPSTSVILSTTTSTQDSGLLDVLVPLFERKTGLSVKTISVGTGRSEEHTSELQSLRHLVCRL